MRLIVLALGLATIAQTVIAIWGPFWPTTPDISYQNNGAVSLETLPFQITHQSFLFRIKEARLLCSLDLIYFIDVDRKTGILRDSIFTEGATSIDPNVAYSCDSKFIRVLPDGSLRIGFSSGQNATTAPKAFHPPIKILKMCVQISGDYNSLGVGKQFKSAMFQWPGNPGGNQWVKGPIAFDNDQSVWIPKYSKLGGAWGLRALTQKSDDGTVSIRPDALRCDWDN